MRLHIGKSALQKNAGVIAQNRIHSGSRVAKENDAGQQKWDYILPPQQRIVDRVPCDLPGIPLCLRGLRRLFHFLQFKIGLFHAPGTKQSSIREFSLPLLEKPAGRLAHKQAARHEQYAGRE